MEYNDDDEPVDKWIYEEDGQLAVALVTDLKQFSAALSRARRATSKKQFHAEIDAVKTLVEFALITEKDGMIRWKNGDFARDEEYPQVSNSSKTVAIESTSQLNQ